MFYILVYFYNFKAYILFYKFMFSFQKFIEKKISSNRSLVKKIKKISKKVGFNAEHWIRYPAYKMIKKDLSDLETSKMDTLEISAGEYWSENFKFKNYSTFNFPNFDICNKNTINFKKKFDLIIADNVWEHLEKPYLATRNVYELLNSNGYFLIITPFLVRVHNVPVDCTRWTERGLKNLLIESGFFGGDIKTNSWGNKECVKSNLRDDDTWTRIGFHKNFKNNKKFPVQVWAIAKKNEIN